MFQEAISVLWVLNKLNINIYINSLGKKLGLVCLQTNLFLCNNAISVLGNIVDSSSFAMVKFVGHSFLNSAHSL